jgi:hypothetical protein
MTPTALQKTTLTIASLVAVAVGLAFALIPMAFLEFSGVSIEKDVNLFSDIRSNGGGILMSGVLIGLGVFLPSMTMPSLILSTCLYFAFGGTRFLAMAVDGVPNRYFVTVASGEIIVAIVCLIVTVNSTALKRA